MDEIIKQITDRLDDLEKRISLFEVKTRPAGKDKILKQAEINTSDDLILQMVNRIAECDESDDIQKKVLDQRSTEGKILLGFYISYKYFNNAWLTTGDIEKITSGLGTKIAVGNVSNKIKEGLRQYLENGSTRKMGQPTPYRLNRQGVKRFEEILHV